MCQHTAPQPRCSPRDGRFHCRQTAFLRIFVTWFLGAPRRVQPRERDQLEICVQNRHTHAYIHIYIHTHLYTRALTYEYRFVTRTCLMLLWGCICGSRVCRADRPSGRELQEQDGTLWRCLKLSSAAGGQSALHLSLFLSWQSLNSPQRTLS